MKEGGGGGSSCEVRIFQLKMLTIVFIHYMVDMLMHFIFYMLVYKYMYFSQERAGLMGFAGTVAGTIMACTVGR